MIDAAAFDHYRLRVPAMDAEHWALIEILHALAKARDVRLATGHVDAFILGWREHMADEEAMLRQANFPFLDHHCEVHQSLVAAYAELKQTVIKQFAFHETAFVFAKRAEKLILDHIDNYDRQYLPWLSASGDH